MIHGSWELPTILARKAKELVEGMQSRVKRNPDVADFRAAFLPIVRDAFKGHRLLGLHCHPVKEIDIATCECGWNSPEVSSVGLAFDEWFDHVNEMKGRER